MNGKPKILVIYTGGTIGMVKNSENGSLRPMAFHNILDELPELKDGNYEITTFTYNPPLDSSNIKPIYWLWMSSLVTKNYDDYDGFVILHGTDTMAYSASMLSFLFENLAKPVIFTGSQLPMGLLRTDAKENLIAALEIASHRENGKPIVNEVCIFFQNKLYRGNRTTKSNAEEFKAFQSYNYPSLAESGVHIKYNYNAIGFPRKKLSRFKSYTAVNTDVAILKIFPGMNEKLVSTIFNTPDLRGIILETFGAGNAPDFSWFMREIDKAIKRGIFIMNVTQCAGGAVDQGRYETSIQLEKMGVLSGYDITTEAAVTKMMYVFGQDLSRKDIRRMLSASIRGEITI